MLTQPTMPGAIGNFAIEDRLGRGGMGEVWRARQHNVGTRVAIKLLLPDISHDDDHVQRFFNEARAVSGIQHAGIVKIFDVGYAAGRAYLIMELLEGEPLAARIKRCGRLPLTQIADIGKQIASVLEATHLAGVTHRDLKPDNVFIVPDRECPRGERVKILDFGIAKLTGALAGTSPRTLGMLGTPAYMAPEQWGDAAQVDWRADLYSLGCLAFEMTCGRPPFVASSLADACAKHLHDVPVRARTLAPHIPAALDELLARMLEKDPARRPPSMREVMHAFDALGRGDTDALAATLRPVSSRPRRRWPVVAGAFSVAVASVVLAMPSPDASASSASIDVAVVETADTPRTVETRALPAPPPPPHHAVRRPAAPVPITIAPQPAPAEVVVEPTSDELSNEAIIAVLEPLEPSLMACVKPDSPDRISMELLISPEGKFFRATPLGSQAHTPLGLCVSKAIIRARFPTSRRGARRTFTFML